MKHVEIFTDGACKGNPGPGGWAALLRLGKHEKELSGGEAHTTNNVIDGMTKWVTGWQKKGWINASKKPVRNEDLWHELIEAAAPHTINWQWVKGHDGHVENERVDKLACAEADAART